MLSFDGPLKNTKAHRQPLSLPAIPSLPLQISLPDLAVWLAKQPANQEDEPPILLRFLADLPSAKSCGLRAGDLLALANHISFLIVLDGFDEVGATQDRQRLVTAARELFTTLASKNNYAQIVATTRPQGYAGELAHLGLSLQQRYLAPLLRDEALDYARKLVEAKIPGADLRTKTLMRLHEAAAESATERLLTTPLQVTILTALVQQLGRAPRERWNLFSRYFSYTYDREIERETYASRLLAEHRAHIERIHARVALLLQIEAEHAGGASARMPRARLEEVIEAVLSEDEVAEDERKDLVKDIAVAAEQRLVFLVEPEPGSFGFEIRSLQEFMAAWALTSGRDTEIEARLQQVAKAPMFRNVALFAASRLFSEGSPLRDVLASRICGTLDDDLNDEPAHFTHAGGMLALETLEEGAVLSQPKRARALMERAVTLLQLPPGGEHARLARTVNSDTHLVLRDAIELAIANDREGHQLHALSAWVSLIAAANREESWAIKLADETWKHLSDPTSLLLAFSDLGLPLGRWVSSKIAESGEKFKPEDFINLPTISLGSGTAENWTVWLCAIFDNRRRWRRRRTSTHIFCVADPSDQVGITEPEEPAAPPAMWSAWIAAARHEVAPSATSLAGALITIAESLPIQRWRFLMWRCSWPLATCLGAADTPDDLRALAALVLSGRMGQVEDWRRCESFWAKKFNFLAILDDVLDGIPWSKESLERGPPLFSFPVWVFDDQLSGKKSSSQLKSILDKANRVFQASQSTNIRRSLAETCLRLLQIYRPRALGLTLDYRAWLNQVSGSIGFLVPRPPCISRSDWLQLLDTSTLTSHSRWIIAIEEIVPQVEKSQAHPVVLRLSVLSLGAYLSHVSSRMWIRPDNVSNVARLLRDASPKSKQEMVDIGIVEIFLGILAPERKSAVVNDIATLSIENPSLYAAFLSALKIGSLPLSQSSDLLVEAYKVMGKNHPQAAVTIQMLRDTLQTRRSDLDSPATWNRLALPLPFPRPIPHPGGEGSIPSRPVKIESIELHDVRGLHHLNLKFEGSPEDLGQWIVILGPNGIGKTTILRSLALALRNTKDPAIWPNGVFSNGWQRVAEAPEDYESIEARITVRLEDGTGHTTIVRQNESVSVIQSPEYDRPRLFPLFAYGCRRGSALGGAARQVNLNDNDGPEIATIFDDNADLIHAETWFIHLEGDALKNAKSKVIFDAVCEAIKTLLNITSIEVINRQVWVNEPGRPKLPFSSLSDGYLTSAGWLIDLIARWLNLAEHQDFVVDAGFMKEMRGLVLIDEIDLHLHPSWQVDIIARTRSLMPQMSFVVTTHNPLTLVGAKAEEIWILSNDGKKVKAETGVDAPMLLSGGQIYRRYFGIEDIYPHGLGRSVQRYGVLSGYPLRDAAEQAEMIDLQAKLSDAGIDLNWDIVPKVGVNDASRILETVKKRKPVGNGES